MIVFEGCRVSQERNLSQAKELWWCCKSKHKYMHGVPAGSKNIQQGEILICTSI